MMKTHFRNRDGNTAPYLQAYQPFAMSRGATSSESEVKGPAPKRTGPLSSFIYIAVLDLMSKLTEPIAAG